MKVCLTFNFCAFHIYIKKSSAPLHKYKALRDKFSILIQCDFSNKAEYKKNSVIFQIRQNTKGKNMNNKFETLSALW